MKKIILASILMALVSLAVFVAAWAGEGQVAIYKGWNLVYGFISPEQIQGLEKQDIKAIYAFIPTTQKYVRLYPNAETDLEELEDKGIIDDNEMLQTAFWVYSNSETGEDFNGIFNGVEYWAYDLPNPLNERPMYKGWNFVGITSEFEGKNLNDLKGNCNIEKSYAWWAKRQIWDLIALDDAPYGKSVMGLGIVIKVSENCKLGKVEEISPPVSPPGLPGLAGDSETCTDSDGGKNYYVIGKVSGYEDGVYYEAKDECVKYAPEEYLVLTEEYCVDNKAFSISYRCPNGCSNGACIQ